MKQPNARSILLVEEQLLLASEVEELLESFGYSVSYAPSGEETFAALRERDREFAFSHLRGQWQGLAAFLPPRAKAGVSA